MSLNRRIHLAPQRPRFEPTEREVREGRRKAAIRLSTPSLICGISIPNRKAFKVTPASYRKGFHAPSYAAFEGPRLIFTFSPQFRPQIRANTGQQEE